MAAADREILFVTAALTRSVGPDQSGHYKPGWLLYVGSLRIGKPLPFQAGAVLPSASAPALSREQPPGHFRLPRPRFAPQLGEKHSRPISGPARLREPR